MAAPVRRGRVSTDHDGSRGIIARMNALNDLPTEVKFRERMRGYDYEEVDAYVKAVSRVAAQAQDQMAELEQRLTQSESQAGTDDGVTEIRETLLRTLVLAQRTADSAVSEARSEAKSMTDSAQERATKTVSEAETAANERLRSAEERAARMLAEAEENGRLIIAEAKRTAAAELASERARAQEEIQALETTKRELETVVAEIQARLEDERNMLRGLSVSFQSFVEKFEPVADIAEFATQPEAGDDGDRDTAPPDLAASDVGEGEAAPDADSAGEDRAAEAVTADDGAAGVLEGAADDGAQTDRAVEAGVEEPTAEADPEPPGGPALEFLPVPEESAHEPQGGTLQGTLATGTLPATIGADTVPELPVIEWDDEIAHDPSDGADAAEPDYAASGAVRVEPASDGNGPAHRLPDDSRNRGEAASTAPATMPFGVDSPELFDIDAEEDDEFIEQLRQVVSSDAPLPDTDAAMAAFFDHDEDAGSIGGAPSRGGRLGPRA